jgi:hypothetical protein
MSTTKPTHRPKPLLPTQKLREIEKERAALFEQIKPLPADSLERKKLVRRRTKLDREARKVRDTAPIETAYGGSYVFELRAASLICQQIEILKGTAVSKKGKKQITKYIGSEIKKQSVLAIFELYNTNYAEIIELVEKSKRTETLGIDDYELCRAGLEKRLKKGLGYYAGLASHIYMQLVWDDISKDSGKQKKKQISNLEKGIQFENECFEILRSADFDVENTSTSGDYGIDLIAKGPSYKIGIQCKSFSTPVGISAVQEVIGGTKKYKLDFAVVVSTSGYTPAAKELAATSGVMLIGPKALKNLDVLIESLF